MQSKSPTNVDTDTVRAADNIEKGPITSITDEAAIPERNFLGEISRAVLESLKDDGMIDKESPFYVIADKIIGLGNDLEAFLETHIAELAEEQQINIRRMTTACYTLNLKLFYLNNNSEGTELSAKFADYPHEYSSTENDQWGGIKSILYGPSFNDVREEFRYRMVTSILKTRPDYNISSLDHLERFLPVIEGKNAAETTILTLTENPANFQLLNIDFERFKLGIAMTLREAGVTGAGAKEDMRANDYLRRVEEILASTGDAHLKKIGQLYPNFAADNKVMLTFTAKQEKIAFIRALRFGLLGDTETVLKDILEISNSPDFGKDFGRLLRQHHTGFKRLLSDSYKAGTAADERLTEINAYLEKNNIGDTETEAILEKLKGRI